MKKFLYLTVITLIAVAVMAVISYFSIKFLNRNTVQFRIVIQSENDPEFFTPYKEAEMEITFIPTAKTQIYKNGKPLDSDFDKKYPPVKVKVKSNKRGVVRFSLPPSEYRDKTLKFLKKDDLIYDLYLQWDWDVFTTGDKKVILSDIKFMQPVMMIFPNEGASFSIGDNSIIFSWEPYYEANHYILELRRVIEDWARGGFDTTVHNTEINWLDLKQKISDFNRSVESSPKWQVILKPNCEYQLAIRAIDKDNNEISSKWLKFRLID